MSDETDLQEVINGLRVNRNFYYSTVFGVQLLNWLEELQGFRRQQVATLAPSAEEMGLDDAPLHDSDFGK